MTGSSGATRKRRWAVIAAGALAAGAVGAVPASGAIGEAGVRPGRNITVFHNIDFVAVFGYGPVGRRLTVQVRRNGVLIGSASGPSVSTPEGPGLEVNHGPVGAPGPGDCWSGHTPDIRPGDQIVVRDGTATDEVVVDDIRFTGDPVEEAPGGDIVVPFVARRADGTAIPLARLDSPEFRDGDLDIRFEGTDIAVEPAAGGAAGEYTMRYNAPFVPTRVDEEIPPSQARIRLSLLGNGHAIGFGHVAPPLPAESMLVDGIADAPGPALGCESSPSVDHGMTAVSPTLINTRTPATRRLRVRGFSQGATAVAVRLSDADGTMVDGAAVVVGDTFQTWTATFRPELLTELSGSVRVAASFVTAGGTQTAPARTLVRDTVAPGAPTSSLRAGVYRGTQRVSLSGGAGDEVRYTLGNGRQAAPTATRGTLYGRRIAVVSSQTLKMVAVDEAGNVSPVASRRYRIITAPGSPRIRRASAGAPGGPITAGARWAPPSTDNGARVTGYRVLALRLNPNGSVAAQKPSRTLRPRVRSLRMRLPAGRYRFQVRATNALGTSPRSAQSNMVRAK